MFNLPSFYFSTLPVRIDPNVYQGSSSSYDLANPIWYSCDYRKAESEMADSLDLSEDDWSDFDDKNEEDDASDDADSNKEAEEAVQNDKYLIFTTGFKTYSPHQIGIVVSIEHICHYTP